MEMVLHFHKFWLMKHPSEVAPKQLYNGNQKLALHLGKSSPKKCKFVDNKKVVFLSDSIRPKGYEVTEHVFGIWCVAGDTMERCELSNSEVVELHLGAGSQVAQPRVGDMWRPACC